MAKQRFEKGSEMHEFFMEYWKFVQSHYVVEESEEYWKQVTDESIQLSDKYKNKLCRLLVSSFMTYLRGELDEKRSTARLRSTGL